MLTDTTLRSAVETLWDKLWAGGLANPLDAIEQLSFLLFLKRLDEREQDAERAAKLRGKKFTPPFQGRNRRGGREPHAPGQVQEDRDPLPPPLSAIAGERRPRGGH